MYLHILNMCLYVDPFYGHDYENNKQKQTSISLWLIQRHHRKKVYAISINLLTIIADGKIALAQRWDT